jgi:hypothetical protein
MPFRPSLEIIAAGRTIHQEVKIDGQGERDIVHDDETVRERRSQELSLSSDGPTEAERNMGDLLVRLWAWSVNTHMSCADKGGSAWICFELREFKRLHRRARMNDDLAYFVDKCKYTFLCRTPEHTTWESDDGFSPLPPLPAYLVKMHFPTRLIQTFYRMLVDAMDATNAVEEEREERAEERAARRQRVRE